MSRRNQLMIGVMVTGMVAGAAFLASLLLVASLFLPIPLATGAGLTAAGGILCGLILGARAVPHLKSLPEDDGP